jgi:hydrogenase/urease accessory protein HupE
MKASYIYAALCVPGAVLPWWQFLPWAREHGFNVPLFFENLFANGVSGAFAMDIIVSAIVVCAFVLIEGTRLGVRPLWLPIVGTIIIGVSFGLPLFLYMRERRLEVDAASNPTG